MFESFNKFNGDVKNGVVSWRDVTQCVWKSRKLLSLAQA